MMENNKPDNAIDKKPTPPALPVSATEKDADLYIGGGEKRILGAILFSVPFILIALGLGGAAATQSLVSQLSSPTLEMAAGRLGSAAPNTAAIEILGTYWSLLDRVGLVAAIVLLPIGLYLILKSRNEPKPGVAYDERSGKGEASVIPPEIAGWNWGAAFLNFWWGIYYRIWIAFLVFVPVIGSVWWIVLGIKGSEWAWQKNKWLSVEHFKREQKRWVPWAIATVVIQALAAVLLMGLVSTAVSGLMGSSGF